MSPPFLLCLFHRQRQLWLSDSPKKYRTYSLHPLPAWDSGTVSKISFCEVSAFTTIWCFISPKTVIKTFFIVYTFLICWYLTAAQTDGTWFLPSDFLLKYIVNTRKQSENYKLTAFSYTKSNHFISILIQTESITLGPVKLYCRLLRSKINSNINGIYENSYSAVVLPFIRLLQLLEVLYYTDICW